MSTTSRLLNKNSFNKPVSCVRHIINLNSRRWRISTTTITGSSSKNLSLTTIMNTSHQQRQKNKFQQLTTATTANEINKNFQQQQQNINNNCYYDSDIKLNNDDDNNLVRKTATGRESNLVSGRELIKNVYNNSLLIDGSVNYSFDSSSSLLSASNNNIFKLNNSFILNNNFKQFKRKMSTVHKPFVQVDNINPNIIVMEYAVRGPLVIRAGEIEKELKAGVKKPFDEVIRANIGDCHAMGQRPITFIRQVMALTVQPSLLESPDYPDDVKERAKTILCGCQGQSLGSYSDSAGIEIIRRQCANYIQTRDGIPSDWTNVILTAGASQGIKGLLSLLNYTKDGITTGIMVPTPQYPLYSASIAEFGMHLIGYYLDESNNWGLNISELKRSIDEAKKKSNPRAIVIINPGNPTGQVLTKENIIEIIKFAYNEKLVIFADEVYQDNIYDKNSKFHSFKKVLTEMGEPYSQMELASFMSCSKGYMGECGIRGGYMEIVNFDPNVKAMFLKSISAQLCPTTIGQAVMSCIANPPKPGEPSYEQFIKEKTEVLAALKERAELVHKTFNSFEGFSCNPVQGAMYAFPQIKIPPKAIEAAKKAGKAPDVFYAFELLENSGICIVPGSGFGQQPGTYHFRTTILPQTEKLKIMLNKFQKFHKEFMAKYK